MHDAIAQAPVLHVALAFARVHAVPHAPQWLSVSRRCSQPLASFPSQSAHPALHHAIAQVPVPHVAVAFARVHATAQPPQCVSVLSDCSQPFASSESQLP